MRTFAFLIITILCSLTSLTAHADRRHRGDQATASPLRYLPGDSVKVWAYHGADFRQMAVALWPGVSAPALALPPMTAGQRQALARQWGMLAPEHNVVGGGDDPFTDGQAIPALIGSGTAAALWQLTGRANYIDYIERALYNAVLHTARHAAPADTLERRAAATLLATAPGLIYATDRQEETLYVNLYTNSTAHLSLGGRTFSLDQITPMPERGTVKLRFMGYTGSLPLTLRLRLPDWCSEVPASDGATSVTHRHASAGTAHQTAAAVQATAAGTATAQTTAPRMPAAIGLPYTYVTPLAKAPRLYVNGHEVSPLSPDTLGYITLRRSWREGDEIYLTLPLQTRALRRISPADDRPERGAVALQCGPVVYAATTSTDSAYLSTGSLPTLSDSLNAADHYLLRGHLYDLRHTPADAAAPERPFTAEPYADLRQGTIWVREVR